VLFSQDLVNLNDRVPSPGGQTSGIATKERLRLDEVGRVWDPPASLKGCRVVGLRQTDGMPHRPQREDRQ